MKLRARAGIDSERVYLARRDSGLTQEELADKIGCSARAVQNWESPYTTGRQPHPRYVRALAEATGKPIAWFFSDNGTEAA